MTKTTRTSKISKSFKPEQMQGLVLEMMKQMDEMGEPFRHSSSLRKQEIIFKKLIRNQRINDELKDFRRSINLPVHGLSLKDVLFPFEEAREMIPKNEMLRIKAKAVELCRLYKISSPGWILTTMMFIVYGRFLTPQIPDNYGHFLVVENKTYPKGQLKASSPDTEEYPVSILISPYATRKDFENFLNSAWTKMIKPLLDKYQLDKKFVLMTREADTGTGLHDFIYKHRGLTFKENSKLWQSKGYNQKFPKEASYRTMKSRILKERQTNKK